MGSGKPGNPWLLQTNMSRTSRKIITALDHYKISAILMEQAFSLTTLFKNKRSEKLKIGASFGSGVQRTSEESPKKKGERNRKC